MQDCAHRYKFREKSQLKLEHKFLLLTVGLHEYRVKNNGWRKGKKYIFEAFFKQKIYTIIELFKKMLSVYIL